MEYIEIDPATKTKNMPMGKSIFKNVREAIAGIACEEQGLLQ